MAIDESKGALAVAYKHAMAFRVDAHIISIAAEFDAPDRCEIFAAEHQHRAVAAIRHINAVGEGDIDDALRLVEALNPAYHFAGCQVDDP